MRKINVIIILILFCAGFGSGCADEDTRVAHVSAIELVGETVNSVTLTQYKTAQVQLKTLPENALDRSQYTGYTFESGDANVFTVNEKGLIEGVNIGSGFLYITSGYNPEVKLTASVTVEPQAAESIILNYHGIGEFLLDVGGTFSMGSLLEVLPEQTHDKSLLFRSENPDVVSVDDSGRLTGIAPGTARITVYSAATPSVSLQITAKVIVVTGFDPLDRSLWEAETSHQPTSEGTWTNLFDGIGTTFMAMVKPGKSYDGITVPATDTLTVTIDLQEPQTFSCMVLTHRNIYTYLRLQGLSVYGSHDGITFSPLLLEATIESEPQSLLDVQVCLPAEFTFRYIRISYDKWNTESGSTIQVAEINAGLITFD